MEDSLRQQRDGPQRRETAENLLEIGEFGREFRRMGQNLQQSQLERSQVSISQPERGVNVVEFFRVRAHRRRPPQGGRDEYADEFLEVIRRATIKGLTSERIESFEHFDADESLVGERCLVCMNDLQVGTKMVRLDCYVDHFLCKTCTDAWFKEHNTCPTCRHVFN